MRRAFIITVLFILSSCGAKGIQLIDVPKLPEITLTPRGIERSYKSYVYVQEFKDSRPTPFFVKYKRDAFEPASSISPVIRDSIAETLEKKNFVISNTAPIIMTGEVRNWQIRVENEMQSEAELYVQIIDPTGARMFSGVYRGFATYSKISMKEKIIQKALSRAMGEAVKQLISDPELMRLLASF